MLRPSRRRSRCAARWPIVTLLKGNPMSRDTNLIRSRDLVRSTSLENLGVDASGTICVCANGVERRLTPALLSACGRG